MPDPLKIPADQVRNGGTSPFAVSIAAVLGGLLLILLPSVTCFGSSVLAHPVLLAAVVTIAIAVILGMVVLFDRFAERLLLLRGVLAIISLMLILTFAAGEFLAAGSGNGGDRPLGLRIDTPLERACTAPWGLMVYALMSLQAGEFPSLK